MNLLDKTRFVERPQFFDGQTLFADDMQTVEAFNREMRWLHNRLLHQTGAIGNGYAVQGNKGDRVVVIGPGLALDHEGREIVLLEELSEPVPPISGDEEGGPAYFDLTVSYPHDDQLEVTETRIGFCDTAGAIRLREKPVVTWVRLQKTAAGSMEVKDGEQRAAIKRGELVVIARASVLNCQLNDVLSLKQRRSARPSCRPYIGFGAEKDIEWQTWLEVSEEQLIDDAANLIVNSGEFSDQVGFDGDFYIGGLHYKFFGLQAQISTASASFMTVPHYTARIEGNRFKEKAPSEYANTNFEFIDGVLYLSESGVSTFRVQLLLANNVFYTYRDEYEEDFQQAYKTFSECLTKLPALTIENVKPCIANYLRSVNKILAQILLPDNWQIAWMGVEG